MTVKTIQKLNQLNQNFYQQVAEPFSESRVKPWAGWLQLLPVITKLLKSNKEITVLDLGCGNGRFGVFLAESIDGQKISYTGLDTSEELLNDAKKALSNSFSSLQLNKVDLIYDLINNPNSTWLNKKWDLVVCFGFIHHLPSKKLREQLLNKSLLSLNSHGYSIVAAWQFLNSQKLKEKSVSPNVVGLIENELEPNDYILSWDRGITAYRYCHHVDGDELKMITPNEGEVYLDFLADGKENNLNRYLVFQADLQT